MTMTDEQILKAFNGRWRIKQHVFSAEDHVQGEIKALCLDFFRAGILLAESEKPQAEVSADSPAEPTAPMSAIMKADGEVTFSTWWNLYGKKIDRAKCERKWNKLTLAERQACIAATPAYVASTPDLQFRRHPATYLNNKSWENQIIPRNNANSKTSIDQQRLDKLADILEV